MSFDQVLRGIGRSLIARSFRADTPQFELFEDQPLGKGPLGALYAGRDRTTSRVVAIRVLPGAAGPELERRLRQHAALLAPLDKDGLLPILGFGRWKGQLFYAMDRLRVGNLSSLLAETHRFTTDEIFQVALGTAGALAAAWKAGLAPCGLRPTNLFFTGAGSLRLADAGVSRVLSTAFPIPEWQGPYVAPEVIAGSAPDVRSDLYSFGVILYQLATRKLPVDGYDSPASFRYQLLHVTPAPPRERGSTVPRPLERVVLRCLAKNPDDRYQNPETLVEELQAVCRKDALLPSAGEGSEDTGDFEIDEDHLVGEGGMGVLYQARQRSLGRLVVVKVLRDLLTARPEIVKRFRQEAELLAQVNHPNVVQVFGSGTWRKRLFYAMELVDGKDLASILKEKQRLGTEEVLHVAEGVARALSAAWAFKIIHRDIKPSNILLTADGVIKVADFGLAKSLRIPRTDSRLIGGTSEYISPEQGMGKRVDIRSDLYSLGAVLYELVSGHPPFKEGDSFTSTVYQHVHSVPPPIRLPQGAVPEGLEAIILKCLRKKPEQRYQHPEEVLEAIRRLRARLGLGSPPAVEPGAAPAGPRRVRWRLAVAAGLLLSLALGGGGYLLSRFSATRTLFAAIQAPEAEQSTEFEVALFMEDFGRAAGLAESRGGKQSPDFLRASAREADMARSLSELAARENFRRHEWQSATDNLRRSLAGVSESEGRERRAALQMAGDLLRAEEDAKAGRREEALRIYQDYLKRIPAERSYLEEKIRSLKP